MALIMTMIILFRYNTGEMNFLCPGMTAKDCVVDSKGRNSCDGPCKLLRSKDHAFMWPYEKTLLGKRNEDDANMLYENKLLGVPRLRFVFSYRS